MKIVLFGKNGQLGRELQTSLPISGDVIPLGRDDLDISDSRSVQNMILELEPNLIINASAYTDVDLAETQTELAININATSPGVMAETARKIKAVFIHYSTDYVFDGRSKTPYKESDPTNPLNLYGKSKLMGEENIKQAGGACLILRTSWVYSMGGNSFVNKVLGWARTNSTLKIVNDQISNPTWARVLAEATVLLISKNTENLYPLIKEERGIYHLAGSGNTSRFEWARHILMYASGRTGLLTQAIEPASSEEFSTPAARPLFTALDCSKIKETFGIHLPAWKESLQAAMTE